MPRNDDFERVRENVLRRKREMEAEPEPMIGSTSLIIFATVLGALSLARIYKRRPFWSR